ncbi:MAG: aldo/keto reductase [Treponema sp.]|nr:aldo/keto reductase [Treponema sp.]
MKYKNFGQTDKNVSVIGLGGTFPENLFFNNDDIDKAVKLVMSASEMGINYFDTAPDYAKGKSEFVFGLAFKQMKKEFFVSTKSNYYSDPTSDLLRRRLDNSLKILGLEKINFYHIWSIMNLEEYNNIKKHGGPLWGALKAKEEGLIEHLCFSTHCKAEETEIIINEGYFEGVTITYNVLNANYFERGLIAAYNKGLGIAIMNPLGGGLIPRNPETFAYLKEFHDDTVSIAALRYLINKKEITLTLTSAENVDQLNENIKASDDDRILDEKYYERIKYNTSDKYSSFCTSCLYCHGCPAKLDIRVLMMEYDQFILFNKNPDLLYSNVNIYWAYSYKKQPKCIECGICEKKCTQHLPIIKRIKEIYKINEKLIDFLKQITPDVGIYGTGSYTKEIFDRYENELGKIDFNIFLFDSNPEKWGLTYRDKFRIYSPDDILKLGIKKIIIATKTYYNEIYEKLKYLEKEDIIFILPN